MAMKEEEKRLKRCLTAMIECVDKVIGTWKENNKKQQKELLDPQLDDSLDILLENSQLSNNIYAFTLNDEDHELFNSLSISIEKSLDDDLPHLSGNFAKYLLDLLHQYHYNPNEKRFQPPLTADRLHPFLHDLKGLLLSVDAFAAAFHGQLRPVKDFLEKHPEWKDKPGLWQTTLLYSAARNNRLDIVTYLIEEAHCSVNAQNQREMDYVLDVNAMNYTPQPSAASAALHGACYNGHLDVVKYLVEHGADYFIRNQADETPIMNGEGHTNIQQYFHEYLLIKYAMDAPVSLPTRPILDDDRRPMADCWWEYKPIRDPQWYKFPKKSADQLHEALLPSKEFQTQVHLSPDKDTLYYVSMVDFFRSGNYADDPENKVAWVRCRGSSIFNFDCYSLWQIMLLKHPSVSVDPEDTPSMKIETLPEMSDGAFKTKLNVWYRCDPKTNRTLDESINTRRKRTAIHVRFIGESLKFNLETFSFINEEQTIVGYLRWLPKLISNTDRKQHKIVEVDNYQPMTDLEPIPLTTRHLSQMMEKDNQAQDEDYSVAEEKDADTSEVTLSAGINDDDEISNINDVQQMNQDSIDDLAGATTIRSSPTSRKSDTDDAEDANISPEQFFHETVGQLQQPPLIEQPIEKGTDEVTNTLIAQLQSENQKLKDRIQYEQQKIERRTESQQSQSDGQTEEQLHRAFFRLHQLQEKISKREGREEAVKTLAKQIITMEYINIDSFLIQNFLFDKSIEIIDYLRECVQIEEVLKGKIPIFGIQERNSSHYISVTGLQCHQDEFKGLLKRIQILYNLTKSAKDYYRRQLRRTIKDVNRVLIKEIPDSPDWNRYERFYQQSMQNEMQICGSLFDEHIMKEAKALTGQCIRDAHFQSWIAIRKTTDQYQVEHSFNTKLEFLKHKALDEFIQEQVLAQQSKFQAAPSSKSVRVMNEFISKVKSELRENPRLKGISADQFREIPRLLQQIMLYYRCFLLQLPLYESSKELLAKIESNTVTTISTSTGSGKSTLLPALLIAEGYDRVLVTQPRRLPCTSISKRVNATMNTQKDRLKLAGWAISGTEYNAQARILYLTDGLLKERLLYDQNVITNQTRVKRAIVLFIDEVHERSVNIDLCLALIARVLKQKPSLRSKLKVIVSSATLDPSIPAMFRQIPQLKLDEYKMSIDGILHSVKKIYRPTANILDVVLELCRKRQRHDQILCFVSSVSDVYQCCTLLETMSQRTLTACPLIQSQSASEQEKYIEHGTIFFSTTVAETSLTFPSLTYVVDTGLINVPSYDPKKKQTILRELPASDSTIKQRLGRLGRTKSGEYYALYDPQMKREKYHKCQIGQSDLTNIEFSLRRSSLNDGLDHMKEFLPDSPDPQVIDLAVEELKKQGILKSNNRFSEIGLDIAKLPDFGSLAMAKSVLSALNENQCGHDLIALSAILSVLNTSSVLKAVPYRWKSSDGDFMTLLNIMNEILSQRKSIGLANFDLSRLCQKSKLTSCEHVLKRALRRYDALQTSLSLSNAYCAKAQIESGEWESIAKSLLDGYGDNVYVSLKELHGRSHHFVRYHSTNEEHAVLDHQSTLARSIKLSPVPIVFARDIRYSSSVRANAVLSFLGRIESQWVRFNIERKLSLNATEEAKLTNEGSLTTVSQLFPDARTQLNNCVLSLNGPFGSVLEAERALIQKLIMTRRVRLTNDFQPTTTDDHKRMKRNLESVSKMIRIFNPMKWRWENQAQVKIAVNNAARDLTCEMTIEGRDSRTQLVENELRSFLGWLKVSAVIRHPDANVPPRILKPQMRKACLDIEDRISRVTDTKRTSIDVWNSLKGSKATRETRMDVVAWISICQFDCRVEGGFVRDWIVGHYHVRPVGNPSSWISYNTNKAGVHIPLLSKELIPTDLDCHLPVHKSFDIDTFLDALHKYQIECDVFREDWRYVLLLDKDTKTGPFTMDLIEPHVALTHDRIDFDVSNLSLEKDYTKELGMRVDIQHKPYSIELEAIVDNIKHKRFQVLRPIDKIMEDRIQKMISRGWSKVGPDVSVIPNPPPRYQVILVRLPDLTDLYRSLMQRLQNSIGHQVTIVSIEQIKNPLLEEAYLAMKQLIGKQCKGRNPNERELFHGTSGDAIDGILNDGFDDRYWKHGKWGHGAYFADNPEVSHGYAEESPTDQTHVMFYNKVTLGKAKLLQDLDQELAAAPIGFHSVHGQIMVSTNADEFIVYRYGQALPYLKITYKC